jgi:hypothetical protein
LRQRYQERNQSETNKQLWMSQPESGEETDRDRGTHKQDYLLGAFALLGVDRQKEKSDGQKQNGNICILSDDGASSIDLR